MMKRIWEWTIDLSIGVGLGILAVVGFWCLLVGVLILR